MRHENNPVEKNSDHSDPGHTAGRQNKEIETQSEDACAHARRHSTPDFIKSCARCVFLAKRSKLEQACVWQDPRPMKQFTWLTEQPDPKERWGVGCHICMWAECMHDFAKCRVRSINCMRPQTLKRHGSGLSHRKALQKWLDSRGYLLQQPPEEQSSSQSLLGVGGQSLPGVGGQTPTGVVGETPTVVGGKTPTAVGVKTPTGISDSHIISLLTSVHNKDSFRSWSKWAESMRLCGAKFIGGDHSGIGKQILEVCAAREKVTQVLLETCVMASLMQDARAGHLLIMARMVLWTWPRQLRGHQVSGVVEHSGPPWVAERILGIAEIGADHGAEAQSAKTLEVIRAAYVSSDSYETNKGKWRSFFHK